MTPTEALSIIDQATGMLQLNRADHIKIVNAINTIKAELDKAKPAETVEDEQKVK